MCHTVSGCLTVEEADVVEGGSSDGEASLAVPNNVPLVWTQAVVGVLYAEGGDENTHQITHFNKTVRTAAMQHTDHFENECQVKCQCVK